MAHANNHNQALSPDAHSATIVDLLEVLDPETLIEEVNILRLEGRLFCFNPKEAKRRQGKLTYTDEHGQVITIELHPEYGQPSVRAYKILQAIFKKLTEEGLPAPETVTFSQRELARIIGCKNFGGNQSRQLYQAVMQLHRTHLTCTLYNKVTKRWVSASFSLLPEVYFSGIKDNIEVCLVRVAPSIVESLNSKHWACFNWNHLSTLEPIGMALYKRLFRHFSNHYHPTTRKEELRFEKDYEAVLSEWLGGLKPERYKSLILSNQLGTHFTALRKTGLIRKASVEKKADGSGFKLVFQPGAAFFDDYQRFYLKDRQPRFQFARVTDLREVQQPLELVAHFHRLLGHSANTFSPKEVAFASSLLSDISYDDARDLIAFAVERASDTHFAMRFIMAVAQYVPEWRAENAKRREHAAHRGAIERCPHCDSAGFLTLSRAPGRAPTAYRCPHSPQAIEQLKAQHETAGER